MEGDTISKIVFFKIINCGIFMHDAIFIQGDSQLMSVQCNWFSQFVAKIWQLDIVHIFGTIVLRLERAKGTSYFQFTYL